MFVVTVSFKHCPHQVVLRYKTQESLNASMVAGKEFPNITRIDDFGTTAYWTGEDVACASIVDLTTSLKGRNTEDKIRARAMQDLKQDMQNDPALEFVVDRSPFFGRK